MKRLIVRAVRGEIKCAFAHMHTSQPEGYIQWFSWAKDMSKTHVQRECLGCGLLELWTPKSAAEIMGKAVSR
jgi:hypothetical protein